MGWFCFFGTIREKKRSCKNKCTMTDFRKSDPTYVNFTPSNASEAIEKFYRQKNLGVPPHLWPEVFVDCASGLTETELGKFEAWLVNPQGQAFQAPAITQVDVENEKQRKQLLEEATVRNLLTVPEVNEEHFADDEKTQVDFEMVNLTV